MIIEEIELFQVAMPIKAPWKTAFGEIRAIDAVFVRMRIQGKDGWGETAPYQFPQYCNEWAGGAFNLMRDVLAPTLVGKNIESGQQLQDLLAKYKGNYFAKAGLDNAWWDGFAKTQNRPLWSLIGGQNDQVTVGADIPVLNNFTELFNAITVAQSQGFERIKLKFCQGWGLEMVAFVREYFPDIQMHIDCNSGYSLDDIPMFEQLDQFDLAMIEQPLAHDDLIDHAKLQAKLFTPICLDESITSLDKARKAIAIGACGWINLKPGRVGGLTNALAIHEYCQQKNMPCWVGSMLESTTGQGAALALATLSNMQYPADIFPSDRLYDTDFSSPEINLTATSTMTAPDRAGHGFTPDIQRLKSSAIDHAIVRA